MSEASCEVGQPISGTCVDETRVSRSAIRVNDLSGRLVIEIGYDGNITLGEGVSLTDASELFWRAIADRTAAGRPYPHLENV